jgi:hypothetical protein
VPTDSFRSHFAKSRACRFGGLGIALVKMACRMFYLAGPSRPDVATADHLEIFRAR